MRHENRWSVLERVKKGEKKTNSRNGMWVSNLKEWIEWKDKTQLWIENCRIANDVFDTMINTEKRNGGCWETESVFERNNKLIVSVLCSVAVIRKYVCSLFSRSEIVHLT